MISIGLLSLLIAQANTEWQAESAEPFLYVSWDVDSRESRFQQSRRYSQYIGNIAAKGVGFDWSNVDLSNAAEARETDFQKLLKRTFKQPSRKERPRPVGTSGYLTYYHPRGQTHRVSVHLDSPLPLRHHSVRFRYVPGSDFRKFLDREASSYGSALVVHKPGSQVATIVVSNPDFDEAEADGLDELIAKIETVESPDLLPPFFESSHRSVTLHYRLVEGVVFKSALAELKSYSLRSFARQIVRQHRGTEDLVVRVRPRAVPGPLRVRFIDAVTKVASLGFQRRDTEAQDAWMARYSLGLLNLSALRAALNDVEEVSAVVRGASATDDLDLHCRLRAAKGSSLAKVMRAVQLSTKGVPSAVQDEPFSMGFAIPQQLRTAISQQVHSLNSPEDAAEIKRLVSAVSAVSAVQVGISKPEAEWIITGRVATDSDLRTSRVVKALAAFGFGTLDSSEDTALLTLPDSVKRWLGLAPDDPSQLHVASDSKSFHFSFGSQTHGEGTEGVQRTGRARSRTRRLVDILMDLQPLTAHGNRWTPRRFLVASERGLHNFLVRRSLSSEYQTFDDSLESLEREIYVATMQYEPTRHRLLQMLRPGASSIRFSVDVSPETLQVNLHLDSGVRGAIEGRERLVSRSLLAHKAKAFQSLTPSELLNQLKSLGIAVPPNLRGAAEGTKDPEN